MSPPPLVTFLISTYNRRDVLLKTLAELRTIGDRAGVGTETVVVDNASRDGTADAVAAGFPEAKLIRSRSNRGACAKNDGLAVAAGRFIVFLDDDSYPTPESLPRMASHFDADPTLGAAVFDVVLPNGTHECSAYPDVFIGCGTGFRRETLAQVGGLPDDYFMQAEEYDLSLRLLNAGWRVRRFTDLLVHHLKTPSARVPTRTTRLDVRNNLTLLARHAPRPWAMAFAIDWGRRYWWIAGGKDWRHRLAFARGVAEAGVRWVTGVGRRRPVSAGAFEHFARIEQIRRGFANLAAAGVRSVLLLDVGKNVLPYHLGAMAAGVRVVAIADPRLAKAGRRYRGADIVSDEVGRGMTFDAAVVANASPVHAAERVARWQDVDPRPVVDLLAPSTSTDMTTWAGSSTAVEHPDLGR